LLFVLFFRVVALCCLYSPWEGEKSKSASKKSADPKKEGDTEKPPKMEEKKVEAKQEEFSHQAGGHVGAFLKGGEGQIMKRVGNNEFGFYSQTLSAHSSCTPYLPKFYGTQEKDGNKYVIIEDLTQYYKKPCILDVKIGTTSVGEDATPDKRAAMEKKDKGTTTVSLGLRITAMKVYQTKTDDFKSFDKVWGKSVTDATVVESLSKFLDNGEQIRKELVDGFIEILRKIQAFFDGQRELRFYSSSLLFLYDGKKPEDATPRVDIRMIDFAHVHEIKDGGKDDGYIFGLKNLIEQLEKISAL